MRFGKPVLSLIILAGILGGVVGSTLVPRLASANFLDDVFNFFRPHVSDKASTTLPAFRETVPSVSLYKPVIDYEEAVVKAVETAAESVVSIVISKDVAVIEQCPYDPFSGIPPEFRDFFGGGFGGFTAPCERGTELRDVGGGSGFLVSADGLVVTNKHVVADTKAAYTVFTNDGKKFQAEVVARDPLQDLAVLRIQGTGFTPARLGNSDTLKLGQTAIAIGNSLGEFRNTVSVGVISGLARTITASGEGVGTEVIQGVIQTDAAINLGNSGGPLLNLKGEVVGISVAVASGAENIGFAIPINRATRAIESVKKTGTISTSYLGVRYKMVEGGALVRGTAEGPGVIPDSPAADAGLRAEDLILAINGEKLTKENPLGAVIQKYNAGDAVTLSIRRGEAALSIPVTLGERPK
ncbi:MAG: trypsin-like peptidase domain-containing protein [Candidatus Jorgensenbacteria bacterium]|nr:trypsin-like peptidase domain-containing protein [Candidatus Jorgensenbacteria bacterium]